MHSPPMPPTSRLIHPALTALTVVLGGTALHQSWKLATLPKPDYFNHCAAQSHLNDALPRCLRAMDPRSPILKAALSTAITQLETPAHRGNYLAIAFGLGEQLGRDLLPIQRSLHALSAADRLALAADTHELAGRLDPIAAELSRIAPEVRPYFAPFGHNLQTFAERLREFSQRLLTADMPAAARTISMDLLHAFVLTQDGAVAPR